MRVIRAEQLTRSGSDANTALERHCLHTARCEIAGITLEFCTDMPDVARIFALRYADHPATREPDFRYYAATVRGGCAGWSDQLRTRCTAMGAHWNRLSVGSLLRAAAR